MNRPKRCTPDDPIGFERNTYLSGSTGDARTTEYPERGPNEEDRPFSDALCGFACCASCVRRVRGWLATGLGTRGCRQRRDPRGFFGPIFRWPWCRQPAPIQRIRSRQRWQHRWPEQRGGSVVGRRGERGGRCDRRARRIASLHRRVRRHVRSHVSSGDDAEVPRRPGRPR